MAHSPADGSARTLLAIDNVSRRFGAFTAVDALSLELREGEFFALLGPSGCGKTTLLRMLAGFDRPDEGRLLLDGMDMARMPPHRRPVNMMFQNYALFPHLTVADNVAFGLKRAGMAREAMGKRVDEMLELVNLSGFGARKPDQLSGGQRQRVALARALALGPRLLLLDEPMAALDKKLREHTQAELKELQRQLGTTFIIVTHDQDEAMTVADRIGVMDRGRLVQVGPPPAIYENPASRWVAGFVGDINLFEARVVARTPARLTLDVPGIGTLQAARAHSSDNNEVAVAIRPEKMTLGDAPAADANVIRGTLSRVQYLGGTSIFHIQCAQGASLRVAAINREGAAPAVGAPVSVACAPENCLVLEI